MKRLALLGASGHGKVVADAALASGWDEVEFFDDAWPQRSRNGLWPVTGDSAALMARLQEFQGVLVSIGDCAVRWEKHQALLAAGASLVTVVHPAATVSRHARLGLGTVVMAGAVVNIDAIVGQAGIINTGATVDHDCQLGDAVHICPGAHLSGNVRVGCCSWVGVGAAVKQGMTIGDRAMVGAGAVVVQLVPDAQTVVGNPARLLEVQKS
ncbi:MAG: acetyltransferase [Burkholderiales bacterium]|nr:acetyltransferase [Burkholderiales bacterium]